MQKIERYRMLSMKFSNILLETVYQPLIVITSATGMVTVITMGHAGVMKDLPEVIAR
jgi:hypothetical protein